MGNFGIIKKKLQFCSRKKENCSENSKIQALIFYKTVKS